MTRIAIGLEYDGSHYVGWQAQSGHASVQGAAEAAVSRVADEPVQLTCAGRTDAGVHALCQVAHFDTAALRSARGWVLGANTHLPGDVCAVWARAVPEHFHARYSAAARTYRYYICNRRTRSALAAARATMIHHPLDEECMRAGAAALIGEHDFSAFRSAECQARSPIRRLESLSVQRQAEWVVITVTANAFLHHMVRNIAGLLIAVGQGKCGPARTGEVLESRDRTQGAATAPPEGLYLWQVHYPEAFGLPVRESGPTSAMIPGLPELMSPG